MAYKHRDTKSHLDTIMPVQNHISTAAEIVTGLFNSELSSGLSDNQKAYRAWFSANGKFEQAHTCGVFLKDMSTQKCAPVLYVYLDKSGILQDFTTNKEIYLIRLTHIGFEVSDIQFRLSKYPKHSLKTDGVDIKTSVSDKPSLQPATIQQKNQAEQMTKNLSEPLKTKVYNAIISSMRRQTSKDSFTE
ncbi:hypothetical protein [Atopobium fossor]|uniref:hypothetical protein n=1 Tax=Atopobium fossor TaxID=39487 RepID=UPI00041D5E0D|nr:hypothetical protein [Atopobium fossor]